MKKFCFSFLIYFCLIIMGNCSDLVLNNDAPQRHLNIYLDSFPLEVDKIPLDKQGGEEESNLYYPLTINITPSSFLLFDNYTWMSVDLSQISPPLSSFKNQSTPLSLREQLLLEAESKSEAPLETARSSGAMMESALSPFEENALSQDLSSFTFPQRSSWKKFFNKIFKEGRKSPKIKPLFTSWPFASTLTPTHSPTTTPSSAFPSDEPFSFLPATLLSPPSLFLNKELLLQMFVHVSNDAELYPEHHLKIAGDLKPHTEAILTNFKRHFKNIQVICLFNTQGTIHNTVDQVTYTFLRHLKEKGFYLQVKFDI